MTATTVLEKQSKTKIAHAMDSKTWVKSRRKTAKTWRWALDGPYAPAVWLALSCAPLAAPHYR